MKLNIANIAIIKRLLVGRASRPLRSILTKLEPADLAALLNQLNTREAHVLMNNLISLDRATETLLEVPEPKLPNYLKKLSPDQFLNLVTYSSEDEATYFLQQLSEAEQEEILIQLPVPKRERVKQCLSYPEDSAGRLMQTNVFCLSQNLSAQKGLDKLREFAQEDSIYYIYCIDNSNHLQGIISLRQLAIAPPQQLLQEIIKSDVITVSPDSSSKDVAHLVAHYDYIALPVVDDEQRLLGIVTVDDVLDVIQEKATADIYAQAGLQEDDRVITPALTSIKNRVPWMLLNLLLAALASSVVSLFEKTMAELIILASLKNIVAGLGGNTAIQTLTVVTRGIATGDFKFISYYKAILKETIVGLTMGLITGLGAAILTYVWKGHFMVSVIIFISMVLNSLVASSFGALVPLAIKRLGGDPATGSGVIVTMITDIFSFFSFLGIASLGLTYFT